MSITQIVPTVDIPGYRIVRSLGEGGMASVYLAVQESLDREVALKVMSPQLAANAEFTDRFLKEGRLTAKLSHPNLVTVYDIGQHAGIYYLAQEYLPGGTLRERLNRGLGVIEILDVARDVALGLAFAHEKGVVHRDVKPGNVLFRNNGTAVLADFGIAKAMNSNTMATQAGNSIGTPHYMSPEQARAEKVDGRSDLYSLGAMLFEMLSGQPPYDSSDPYTIALMHVTHALPKLPPKFAWVQPLIDRLMAKLPEQRYATGDEFVAACERLMAAAPEARALRDPQVTRRRIMPRPVMDDSVATQRNVAVASVDAATVRASRPWLPLAGGILLAVAAASAWLLWPRDPVADPKPPTDPVPVPDPIVQNDPPPLPPPVVAPAAGDIAPLLERANALVRDAYAPSPETRIPGQSLYEPEGDNAIELYRRVLAAEPGNAEALAGLERAADFLEQRARLALQRGTVFGCATLVEKALLADPDRPSLIELRDGDCRF